MNEIQGHLDRSSIASTRFAWRKECKEVKTKSVSHGIICDNFQQSLQKYSNFISKDIRVRFRRDLG